MTDTFTLTYRDTGGNQHQAEFEAFEDAKSAGLSAVASDAVNVWIWPPVELGKDGRPKNIFRFMPKLMGGRIDWVRTTSLYRVGKYIVAAERKATVVKDANEKAALIRAAVRKAAANG